MAEFLAENNVCGQNILQLVSRGNAIIAELLRLKDYIPAVYYLDNKLDVQKYSEIILDFNYFRIAEAQENKIENSENLRELDDEFRDNHINIISRFYLAFESIHTYVTDLNHFLDELDDGIYIHQSLQTIFSDVEGRQLMCEALYLYGLMLLMIDAYIESSVRERLLVSYYRYTPQRRDTATNIDDICKLLRDTGYASPKRPANYPEDYFKRIVVKPTFVDVAIGRLRSDDIYNQLSVYPLSKHRSTALATQASMLYVCLFFSSNILHNHTAIMREIVDKYFPDNWVISIYIGFTVNLIETWESFRAAKLALNNTLDAANVKSYANVYGNSVPELLRASNHLLKEGNLTEENVLNDINNICNMLRDFNVTTRWLILHTMVMSNKAEKNKKCKQIRDLVIAESKFNQSVVFKLLLNTAQLELTTRDIIKKLLAERETKWKELKNESYQSLVELSEVFSGTKPLTRIQKNANLQKWFSEISKEVDALEEANSKSGRKIVQLIQALEEVQEFHQLNNNMQVIQFLSETRKCLHQMIRNMNIKEDILVMLQMIGDSGYAWELIDCFTPIMQTGIKKEPTLCIKLRAIFLKLATALETPLLRINQAHSEDLLSVSQYYSSELEIYVRKVLQIIPKMMFEKMARIIEMQTSVLKELPTRLEKDKIKEYAQLNERFEFAELTHSISVFSEGMRMMKSTLVGVVCLDPKKLLEDGIRKELVQHISKALHDGMILSGKLKLEELLQKITLLSCVMDGYKRSLEYIQDYVNINGLKIWQEEVTRIINFNVEQECNGFLRNKVHAWESVFQSRYVPIPHFPSTDNVSRNFIGRLAYAVIHFTDPRTSIFIEQTSTWYEPKNRKPILTRQILSLISSTFEITGLTGLDRLFSFMIITNLQATFKIFDNKDNNSAWSNIILNINEELNSLEKISNVPKFYQTCINRTTKLWPAVLDNILKIGQLQLLRNLIAFELNKSCKFDAKNLESSLSSLSKSLLLDMATNDDNLPNEDVFSCLSSYFEWIGMNSPLNKIYITIKSKKEYSTILFMFVIAHLQKIFLLRAPGNYTKRGQDQVDGLPMIIGIHTVLKQTHPDLNAAFIKVMCQYITENTKHNIKMKAADFPVEAMLAITFMDNYGLLSKHSRYHIEENLPEELVHVIQSSSVST